MPTAPAHDGTRTTFSVRGNGFPLVLSPVRPRGKVAEGYLDRLSDRYQVVLLDYPGHPKPGSLTPETAAADVVAVLDEAGIGRFIWFGYSFGSVLGLQLALRTDRIAAFVCGGWTPLGAPYASMVQLSERAARLTRPVARATAPLRGRGRPSTDVPAAAPGASAAQYVTFYRALQDFDEHEALDALADVPRLVFVGSKDDAGHSQLASRVASREHELVSSGWDVRYLEGRRHAVLVRPGVVVPFVRSWLDEQPLD
ncbi:MAG TPA: alpha/beta hydrolase [Nitriliruptorales bacterium]